MNYQECAKCGIYADDGNVKNGKYLCPGCLVQKRRINMLNILKHFKKSIVTFILLIGFLIISYNVLIIIPTKAVKETVMEIHSVLGFFIPVVLVLGIAGFSFKKILGANANKEQNNDSSDNKDKKYITIILAILIAFLATPFILG